MNEENKLNSKYTKDLNLKKMPPEKKINEGDKLIEKNTLSGENNEAWTEEDEKNLNRLLSLIPELEKQIAQIKNEILNEEENITDKKNEQFLKENELVVEENIEQKDLENSIIIEEELNKRISLDNKKIWVNIKEALNKKIIKYVLLPLGITTAVVASYNSPQEYYEMYKNYKERHFDKKTGDDPSILGVDELYKNSTDIERSTYDFLGDHKIDYKLGYYMTSVFDLTDRTKPRFKMINDRNFYMKIDSVAGITTNLFKKFHDYNEFVPVLKGHTDTDVEKIGEIPVIAYNKKDQTIKAGHYAEFDENWMVSETYEIPLNFKINSDSTINLVYHDQAMRMVPLSTNEKGKQIPFPIGITYNKKITRINPNECDHFGTLEGGKVIMTCGDKQLQVNGSFSDIYKVYERLRKEKGDTIISAYLLDNGSYNLPIWDKDSIITTEEIKSHMLRNKDGGTALLLINDGKISPYEYKNKYKEFEHYTPNYTLDSITGKPAMNQKEVIVIHHTGNYDDSNTIIKDFKNPLKEVSSHVVIMKNGERHIFNTDNYVLAHAGKSDFINKNAVNYFSLGVELEGDSQDENPFTIAQMESLLEYLRPRIEKYKIPFEKVTTHKIIRENYIKKHPNEKGVLTKRDLDDKVWKQIQELIMKKIYENDTIYKDSVGQKLISSIAYQDIYWHTRNIQLAKKESEKILKNYYLTDEDFLIMSKNKNNIT